MPFCLCCGGVDLTRMAAVVLARRPGWDASAVGQLVDGLTELIRHGFLRKNHGEQRLLELMAIADVGA